MGLTGKRTRLALVVDDDPTVREVIGRMLKRGGYMVIEADGPEAAMKQIAGPVKPEFAIVDVTLGRDNGVTLGKCLKVAHPRLAVIYVSGQYSALTNPPEHFLPKPFKERDLLEVIARVTKNGE